MWLPNARVEYLNVGSFAIAKFAIPERWGEGDVNSADRCQPDAILSARIVAMARIEVCGFTPVFVGNTLESAT